MLQAELPSAGTPPLRIPEDLDSEWTVIVFSQPPPWNSKRDDGLPPSPARFLQSLAEFAGSRPSKDVKVMLATFGGDAGTTGEQLVSGKTKLDFPVFTVPGGADNPLVRRLGILSEDKELNSVLLHKDGRVAVMVSGLANQGSRNGGTIANVITREDEKTVAAMLERGDIEKAKSLILSLAPPFDPEAVDERGRKPKPPQYSLSHLRARARVYMALKEWDKALADAEEVVQRQLGTDGGMSLRTDELDESEALRGSILELQAKSKE